MFTTGGTHSILIDTGNDTSGAVLTVNSSTQFTTAGITEITTRKVVAWPTTSCRASTASFCRRQRHVQLLALATINFDSNNTGSDTLTVSSSTSLGTTNLNGGTDGSDDISLFNSGGTYTFTNNTITNVSTLNGNTGNEVVIPTDEIHDTLAHFRRVMEASRSGMVRRSFQAMQQASTMAS